MDAQTEALPRVGGRTRRWRRPPILKPLIVAAALVIGLVLAADAYVLLSTRGQATDDISEVPHAQAAVVLGAMVHSDGRMSSMLTDRVARAAELWEAGKVDRILVSGDHGEWTYDEPDRMRQALQEAGVPGRVIFTDHAGFDTWATMRRAEEVFQVESAVVVTQGFHIDRALYLADQAGLDATGYIADTQDYGAQHTKSRVRELLARVKAVGEANLGADVLLGKPVPITGDGRSSWGPAPPPGTPPAGAPRD
jgi:SanA protein